MNRIITKILCLALLVVSMASMGAVVPFLQFRSQGFNATRELVGWQTQINKPDMCNFYGSFSLTPEYMKSFKPCKIATYLFEDALVGNSPTDCAINCNISCCDWSMIKIQGTKVVDRDPKALMAENFYLPTDFSSEVSFKPTIDNFLVDFNLYLGLDPWCEGLYFRIHMPVVHTRWDLNFCEDVLVSGTMPYDPGYFNNTTTPAATGLPVNPALTDVDVYGLVRNRMLGSFQEFVTCQGTISGVDGITYNPLNNARMDSCRRHKNGIAELTAALGWNFLNCPDYSLGLNVRAAAPTGNRPEGVWLFEPIVGQGKHWELGAGLDARWALWQSWDEEKDCTVYLDANVTHLFKTRQCRTFDLCGKPLSRYMLAMKFTDSAINNLVIGDAGTATAPKYRFAKEFTPVANLTTLPVGVSAAVQGEVVVKFALNYCNWQFDVGYDFWGRSCEKIIKCCDCAGNGFIANTWGLKGDAFVFGFPYDSRAVPALLTQPAVALSATESKATIFAGTNNFGLPTGALVWNQNPGVDTAQRAFFPVPVLLPLATHQIGDNAGNPAEPVWLQVQSSLPPVLLAESDIDVDGARAKSMSNKVFGHIGYTWLECECFTPYLGVGGEIEFGMRDTSCGGNSCNKRCGGADMTCKAVSLSQWGIWAKGGISFN